MNQIKNKGLNLTNLCPPKVLISSKILTFKKPTYNTQPKIPKNETVSTSSESFVRKMHTKLDKLLEECNQICTSVDKLVTKTEQIYDNLETCGV